MPSQSHFSLGRKSRACWKQRLLLALPALLLFLLAGCGNFSLTQTAPGQTPRFAYAGNFSGGGLGTVSAYTIAANGQLSAAGSFNSGPGPKAVRTDAAGFVLYTANSDGTISAFAINRTSGALVPIAGTFTSAGTPTFLTVDPGAHSVYVANQNPNSVSGFAITSGTGVLVPVPSSATTGAPVRLNFDPSGRFVHVAEGAAGADIFAITATGALLLLQNVPAPPGALFSDILAEPRDKFVYVADGVSGIYAYSFDYLTGKLAPVPGGFFSAGTTPIALAIDPSGLFVFVVNHDSQNVTSFSINTNTGALTLLGSTPAGVSPADLAVDPSGKFLYVADSSGSILEFSIAGGRLSPLGTIAAGQNPVSIAVTP
jgi:6-phosphogluconolactonase